MVTHQGNPVSKGAAVGRVYKYVPYQAVVEQTGIRPEQVEEELAAYRAARERAGAELSAMRERLGEGDADKAAILGAHAEILADPALDEMVSGLIRDEYYNAKWAVDRAFSKFIKMLSRVKDDMIRERIADMKDVRLRLLRSCDGAGEVNLGALTEPVVVVAQDLFPSDTASLKREMVLAIVTEVGGATSHTAIIARSYEIPALLGVSGAMDLLTDGQVVGVDAIDGVLATDLSPEETAALEKKGEAAGFTPWRRGNTRAQSRLPETESASMWSSTSAPPPRRSWRPPVSPTAWVCSALNSSTWAGIPCPGRTSRWRFTPGC